MPQPKKIVVVADNSESLSAANKLLLSNIQMTFESALFPKSGIINPDFAQIEHTTQKFLDSFNRPTFACSLYRQGIDKLIMHYEQDSAANVTCTKQTILNARGQEFSILSKDECNNKKVYLPIDPEFMYLQVSAVFAQENEIIIRLECYAKFILSAAFEFMRKEVLARKGAPSAHKNGKITFSGQQYHFFQRSITLQAC